MNYSWEARCQDSLAEWSKALASGASPQGRGFEPHSCHFVKPPHAQTSSENNGENPHILKLQNLTFHSTFWGPCGGPAQPQLHLKARNATLQEIVRTHNLCPQRNVEATLHVQQNLRMRSKHMCFGWRFSQDCSGKLPHATSMLNATGAIQSHAMPKGASGKHAAGEDRTPDLRIMRPTRCQLRYCRLCKQCVAIAKSFANYCDLPSPQQAHKQRNAHTGCVRGDAELLATVRFRLGRSWRRRHELSTWPRARASARQCRQLGPAARIL